MHVLLSVQVKEEDSSVAMRQTLVNIFNINYILWKDVQAGAVHFVIVKVHR